MNLDTFLELAQHEAIKDWAVREQLESIYGGDSLHEQNESALKIILNFLKTAQACGIDDVEYEVEKLDQYLTARV